jgi:thioesterase domain-containing protein
MGGRDQSFDAQATRHRELLADLLLQPQPTLAYPASLAQKRLWFLDQLQGKNAAYNIHLGFWLRGPLDLQALQGSLQEVVKRHETLQTAFKLEGSELRQVVTPSLTLKIPIEEVVETTETYSDIYRVAQREVNEPFDLSEAPLFRVRILRVTPEDHVLLCTMHHIVTDAWSVQILARELPAVYDAFCNGKPSPLPDLPISYGDYSEWQYESLRTEELQQQLAYWKRQLRDAPAVLDLPMDSARPAEQTVTGASQFVQIKSEIISEFKTLAPRWQATPFMIQLAAFKILLYRYSGQSDLLVGVPVAGRNRVETEALVGFFVNTLVMRDDLSGNPHFPELLAQVRETTLGAFANADVPFEQVVEVLQPERNLSYNPIFQVMFSVIKAAIQTHNFGSLTAYPYIVSDRTSNFDLSASVIEGVDGKWFAQFDFNTDLFDPERIARMLDDYTALLQAISSDPNARILEFPLAHAEPEPKLTGATRLFAKVERQKAKTLVMPSSRRDGPLTSEQELLLGIWKNILGASEIGIHDNFFEIGGHSLLAARLMAQIQERTGQRMPVSAIFRAPTVAALAPFLREQTAAKPDPLAMKLNEAKGELPFFGVAIPAVDTTGFAQLARNLPERPYYKLQASSPVHWERRYVREEYKNLAKQYIDAMRAVQPRGPYCLGAMCLSVLIAQEMVMQLEAVGESVALFVIFDTWVIENSQIRSLWAVDYYFQRWRTLQALPTKEKVARLHRTITRWLAFPTPSDPGENTNATGDGWQEAYWPGEDFRPPQFRAPVLLFKKPKQPYYRIRDAQMGWGARSQAGVEVCEVDCGHVEMLREPFVGLVSEKLLDRLEQINLSGERRDPQSCKGQDAEVQISPVVHSEVER